MDRHRLRWWFQSPDFRTDHLVAMVAVGMGASWAAGNLVAARRVPARDGLWGTLGFSVCHSLVSRTGIASFTIALGRCCTFFFGCLQQSHRSSWIAGPCWSERSPFFRAMLMAPSFHIGADAIAYSMGFVVATGMLHLGACFGTLSHWPAGRIRASRRLCHCPVALRFPGSLHMDEDYSNPYRRARVFCRPSASPGPQAHSRVQGSEVRQEKTANTPLTP